MLAQEVDIPPEYDEADTLPTIGWRENQGQVINTSGNATDVLYTSEGGPITT